MNPHSIFLAERAAAIIKNPQFEAEKQQGGGQAGAGFREDRHHHGRRVQGLGRGLTQAQIQRAAVARTA